MPPSNPKSKASSSSTATDLSQGAYPLHLAHPSARSTSVRASFMPVYARFQPILGTQKCFPRDFRDQFSIFPKIFWIRGLFFKNMSRISGGAKSRFCPVAGGGGVLCRVAVAVSCPAVWACARCALSAGGPVDHYRKTGGPVWITTGEDYRPGPVSISRGFLALSRYCYTGFLARLDLRPCRASLLPCGGLSLALWGFVPARSLRGFCGPLAGLWLVGLDCLRACGVYLGQRACPVYRFGPVCRCLPGFASCLACLGLFRAFWGFICLWVVSCSGVVFLLLYRTKEKRPFVGRFSLGGVGV